MIPLQKAILNPAIPYGRLQLEPGKKITESPFYSLIQQFVDQGLQCIKASGVVHVYDPTGGDIDFDAGLDDLGAILSTGGYFKGIRLGIRIPATMYDTMTPDILISSKKENDSQMTFREWAEQFTYKEKLINSDLIFRAVINGDMFDSNTLLPLFAYMASGLEILFWDEFKAEFNGENYNENAE